VDIGGMIWLFIDQDLSCEVFFAECGSCKVAGDDSFSIVVTKVFRPSYTRFGGH
jgi:hypothetical protein